MPTAVQRPVGSSTGSETFTAGRLSGGGGCGDCSSGDGGGGGSGDHCSRTADRENQAKDGRDGDPTEAGALRKPADPGAGQRTITQVRSLAS